MLWCHLLLVFCVLTVAAGSGSRKRPHDIPKVSGSRKRPHDIPKVSGSRKRTHDIPKASGSKKRPLDIPECEPGPSRLVVGRARRPCTTKEFTATPIPPNKKFTYRTPFSSLEKFAESFEKKFGRQRTIDKPFRLVGVKVVDSLENDTRGITFMRNLFTNGSRASSMNLKIPSPLYLSHLDTTGWEPDHDSLVFNGYTITMIEEMFAYEVAEMHRNAKAKVLSIGLGGGYINSYLHRNYREMNITVVEIDEAMLNISRTWFGLNLDNRHRVIIRDGVEFVKEAASKGETFNVIFLDACTMNRNAPVNCPSGSFLNRDVVRSFHTLLGNRGILVINVKTLGGRYSVALRLVKDSFERSFSKCIANFAPFGAGEMVMTCAEFGPTHVLRAAYRAWRNYTTAF